LIKGIQNKLARLLQLGCGQFAALLNPRHGTGLVAIYGAPHLYCVPLKRLQMKSMDWFVK
jgi:hypothetical protein